MGRLTQISVFAENKPGKLERITEVLAKEKVNILAINIASSGAFGVIKLIVDRPEKGQKALVAAGLTASLGEVLAVAMPEDKPGGLHKVAQALTRHKLNLENAYVFIPKARKVAYLLVEVDDIARAQKRLAKEKLSFYKG